MCVFIVYGVALQEASTLMMVCLAAYVFVSYIYSEIFNLNVLTEVKRGCDLAETLPRFQS